MTLTNLRRFYEQVNFVDVEVYLGAHGWKYHSAIVVPSPSTRLGVEYRREGAEAVLVPTLMAGDFLLRMVEAVAAIARGTERQPTAVLYDLLPASARADFVREILPQVAK
jgi:hypothetical protein